MLRLAAIGLLCAGCSMGMNRAPAYAEARNAEDVVCDESMTLPTMDLLFGIGWGGASLAFYMAESHKAFTISAGVLAALHLYAALSGNQWATECRHVRKQIAERDRRDAERLHLQPAPPQQPPQPPPPNQPPDLIK